MIRDIELVPSMVDSARLRHSLKQSVTLVIDLASWDNTRVTMHALVCTNLAYIAHHGTIVQAKRLLGSDSSNCTFELHRCLITTVKSA